jgi:hypothetical protein
MLNDDQRRRLDPRAEELQTLLIALAAAAALPGG